MAIVVFDIGGTAVKYGLWLEEKMVETSTFDTPSTWIEMTSQLLDIFETFKSKQTITGVAISSPGAVNLELGIIEGISAVPYIHHFPIIKSLEKLFNCAVSIENDANCAALAEVWQGNARKVESCLFIVIGSGIGGALMLNQQVIRGYSLFGGEFGYMLMNETQTFSELASPVVVARNYGEKYLSNPMLTGKELFELADEGDYRAKQEIDKMYDVLARGVVNLAVSFNPEKILIGGGLSSRSDLLISLEKKVDNYRKKIKATDLKIPLGVCKFNNQANLIGAVAHFNNIYAHQ